MNIVGVGNVLMGDDGVGPAAVVAMAARADLPAAAHLYDAGLAFSDVLGCLECEDMLIVIDAVRAGGQPGTVYQMPLGDLSDDGAEAPAGFSLHEISVMPALRMEALTGRTFAHVTLFGVEPGSVEWGQGISPPVAAALEKLVKAVCQHIRSNQPAALTAGEPAR